MYLWQPQGFQLVPTGRQWELGGPEANTDKRNSVLKALELERVFGHYLLDGAGSFLKTNCIDRTSSVEKKQKDLLDGAVRVDVHFHVFGQLMALKADKGVQQTQKVAQCRLWGKKTGPASPPRRVRQTLAQRSGGIAFPRFRAACDVTTTVCQCFKSVEMRW